MKTNVTIGGMIVACLFALIATTSCGASAADRALERVQEVELPAIVDANAKRDASMAEMAGIVRQLYERNRWLADLARDLLEYIRKLEARLSELSPSPGGSQ